MLASSLVDTSALWKIVAAGFAGGAGVVIAFGLVLLGTSRLGEARNGRAAVMCCSFWSAALSVWQR